MVHLGGRLCDLEGIAKVAKKYNCKVVEDACHAPGSKYINKKRACLKQDPADIV